MGITSRYIYDDPSYSTFSVASSNISKLIKYYTDAHDVDEGMLTVLAHGGAWGETGRNGFMQRNACNNRSDTVDTVAYKDKNTTLSSRMVFLMI